jgi:diguanylate cyclase (GGDEF)-like protein
MTSSAATILIVDDEPQICKLLEAMLHPEGYATRTAVTGEAALASVAEHAPDLIVLDVVMPGMDGYEVATALKGDPTTSHIPIIMVTASTSRQSRLAGLKTGAEDFLHKPVDRSELWLRVRNLLRLKTLGDSLQSEVMARTADLTRLNRVYAVLSGINSLIIRVQDCDELFSEACRIAIREGGLRMAWIALVEPGSMKIARIAAAGHHDYVLNAVKAALASSSSGSLAMIHRTMAEKVATVCNESDGDLGALLGMPYIDTELHSTAVLPLIVESDAIGVLALYSGESGFFDEGEMRLLTELAGNIAFANNHINEHDRLKYLAYYDDITGLANRTRLLERVAQYVRGARSGNRRLALGVIDLERFKNVNNSLGRDAGDVLLRQVAEWLKNNLAEPSLLARVEADHFAVVYPNIDHDSELASQVDQSMDALSRCPFFLNGSEFRVSAKIGVAVFPEDATDGDTLLRNAESALRNAKQGGDRYFLFSTRMTDTITGKLFLEHQLRRALEKEEFVLHYQPKIDLLTGRVTGAEALIRWNDPRTGLVPPARFIPILEETGLIYDVGRWALKKAIEDHLSWRAAGLAAVRIAVNVSARQFRNSAFTDDIRQAIAIDAGAAAGIELEITESLIMENVKPNIATLQAVRALGVTIAVDDFGTGFSSLSYLAKLPLDTLKIDRVFVHDITTGPAALALVSTIITLAHSLKLKVVAEAVETDEQAHLLRSLKCDEMQGFLVSQPVPRETFRAQFLERPGRTGLRTASAVH